MILCVFVREYAACLERLSGQYAPDTPLILVDYSKRGGRVIAVSLSARRAGVQPGLTLSRAQAFCPEAVMIAANPDDYESTLKALLEISWIYTNMVEFEERVYPNALVLYLDIGRLNAEGIATFATGLIQSFSKKHLQVTVGVASGKFPAQIAAQMAQAGEYVYIPPGTEAAAIASAPASLLPLSTNALRTLNLLAIHTLGEFAALPRAAVVDHFRGTGKRLHLLANGYDNRGVKPQHMPVIETARRVFDTPISHKRQWHHNLKILARRLEQRLNRRVSAAHEFTLLLTLEDHSILCEQIYCLHPSETAEGIMQSVTSLLKRMTLTSGILEIELQLSRLVPAKPEQLALFSRKPRTSDVVSFALLLKQRYGAEIYELIIRDPKAFIREGQYTRKLVGL